MQCVSRSGTNLKRIRPVHANVLGIKLQAVLTAQGDIYVVLTINTGHFLHAQYLTLSLNPM